MKSEIDIIKTEESENISYIAYNENKQILQVTFHNENCYEYYGIPVDIWVKFKNEEESKGKFLHENIKGKFRYSKI